MTFCYCDYSCGTMVRDATIHAAHKKKSWVSLARTSLHLHSYLIHQGHQIEEKPVVFSPLPSYTPNCGVTLKQSHLHKHPQPFEPLTSTHTKICHHLFSVTSSFSSQANSSLQGSASSSHTSCQISEVLTGCCHYSNSILFILSLFYGCCVSMKSMFCCT